MQHTLGNGSTQTLRLQSIDARNESETHALTINACEFSLCLARMRTDGVHDIPARFVIMMGKGSRMALLLW